MAQRKEVTPKNPQQKKPQSSNVTTVEELASYAKGMVVDLPPFAPDMPLRARVRRPSMLSLAKQGKIPNELLSSAIELFTKGRIGVADENQSKALSNMYKVCKIIAEATLLEPTVKDFEEAGLEFTDDQLTTIYAFSQQGVEALKAFRKE